MDSRSREGFTLIEVVVAVFVLATVLGTLVTMVAANLARLSEARLELIALQRAEREIRDLEANALEGQLPEPGETEGVYEDGEPELAWIQTVDLWALPLPPDQPAGAPVPSSVFALPNPSPGAVQPSLRRVSLTVYPADREPEGFDPFVVILVERLSESPLGAAAP